MSKKMMKRSLALGALMAFVITGSAMAADKFDSIDNSKQPVSSLIGSNWVVKYSAQDTTTVVEGDRSYKYYVQVGEHRNDNQYNDYANVTVLGQSYTTSGNDLKFGGNLTIYQETNSGRNMTGNAAAKGIDIYNGTFTVDGKTKVDVHSINNANGTSINVVGITAWGYDYLINEDNNPNTGINGKEKLVYSNTAKLVFNDDVNVNVSNVADELGHEEWKGTVYDNDKPGKVTGISINEDASLTIVKDALLTITATGSAEKGEGVIGATATAFAVTAGEADVNGKAVLTAVSKAGEAYGVNVNSSGYTATSGHFANKAQVNFTGDTIITAEGSNKAVGVYVENKTTDKEVATSLKGNNIAITATADEIARGVVAWKGSKVTLGSEADTQNINITVKGSNDDQTYGILAYHKNSEINVKTNTLKIETTGFGIGVATGYEDLKSEQAVVDIKAENIFIDGTDDKTAGLSAMSSGKLNIEGNVEINATDVLLTRGGAETNINTSEGNEYKTVLNGDVNFNFFEGNSDSKVNAKVNINLNGEDSSWTGNTKVNWEIKETGSKYNSNEDLANKLVVKDFTLNIINGAQWTPTVVKESGIVGTDFEGVQYTALNNLVLKDGIVDLTGDGTATVETVNGSAGTFKVNDTVAHQFVAKKHADELVVTVEGSADVADLIAAGTTIEEVAMTVTDGNATIADIVKVEEGLVGGAVTAEINEDGEVIAGSVKQAVNQKAAKVSEAGMNLKAHWRAHMNDMNKRMGELRMANGETGVWTRMVRGENEYQGAKSQYNQYQLGYDEKLSVDKRWTVGAAVTFSEGDGNYGQGSTEDKSTAFAIYGSKLNNDGTFVDLIARYAHMESDLADNVYGNGDYSTNGMSVSAEFGKRIQQGKGFWIEPQVELTYGTVDSADVLIGGKYKAHMDSMDSLVGRVGFSIGKDVKQGNVYARASYLYDFDGETTHTFGTATAVGAPIEEDFGGGWWEVGVGANINLSKATYVYADVEKTFGGEVDTNWQWNLGVRYSF